MTTYSPDKVYENLEQLERGIDPVLKAVYRQQAVETLADVDVSLSWRQAIAQRLDQANRLLVLNNVDAEDSY